MKTKYLKTIKLMLLVLSTCSLGACQTMDLVDDIIDIPLYAAATVITLPVALLTDTTIYGNNYGGSTARAYSLPISSYGSRSPCSIYPKRSWNTKHR